MEKTLAENLENAIENKDGHKFVDGVIALLHVFFKAVFENTDFEAAKESFMHSMEDTTEATESIFSALYDGFSNLEGGLHESEDEFDIIRSNCADMFDLLFGKCEETKSSSDDSEEE